MVKIVHTADIHAGRPAARELDLEKAAIRRREIENALFRIVELVKKEGAQVLLISGDLFEHKYARPSWIRDVAYLFSSIPDVKVFIAPGNHDPLLPDSLYRGISWPGNVVIFREPSLERVVLEELGLAVWGLGWKNYLEPVPLVRNALPAIKKSFDASLVNIMVLHGDYQRRAAKEPAAPGEGLSQYLPLDAADLTALPWDYVALGHIHVPEIMALGCTVVAYPGCPEPLDFGDTGERGVVIVECDPSLPHGGRVKAEFVPTALRKVRCVELDISGADREGRVREAVLALGSEDERKRDLWAVTLRGTVDGTLDLDIPSLERELAAEFFFLRLIPDYRPDYDLESISSHPGLEGRFVKYLREIVSDRLSKGDLRGARVAELAMYYGLDALNYGRIYFRRRNLS